MQRVAELLSVVWVSSAPGSCAVPDGLLEQVHSRVCVSGFEALRGHRQRVAQAALALAMYQSCFVSKRSSVCTSQRCHAHS